MKKIVITLISLFLLVGCSFDDTPKKAVEDLFKKYQSLDEVVINDLEYASESANLKNQEEREEYIKVMRMQYSDLKYEITDKEVNADEATVTANITVYDFYKVGKEADNYLLTHREVFEEEGKYDSSKFMLYKLKQMLETSERVEYTITLYLEKENDKWIIKDLDRQTLEKIHGTYNYENN